jgi:predicted DNA-binding antitoxin AbrB/MazE fold protein
MKQAVDAVYENGVFKPLKSPSLSDGQLVRLEIETALETSCDDLLELAAKVYEGLSDQQIAEVEKIVLDRRDFFGDRTR